MSVYILAIESSCDETSAAVIKDSVLLSNVVASQIDIHTLYGGVVPEIASRNHLIKISEVVDSALKEANIELSELSAVAVTKGPGLIGALLVGVSYAKSLAYALGIPLIGVNHLCGHIAANYLIGAEPPFVCLIASGGHTSIVKVKDYTDYELLGSTRDDAAGEAFDKVARVMGLGYPGGPKLDKLSEEGDETYLELPRVMLNDDSFDFSFSGLKSAVLNVINQAEMKKKVLDKASLCASFRKCICDILVEKTLRTAKACNISKVAICGGVSCNSLLRKMFTDRCEKEGLEFFAPPTVLCSDNAGMIAACAYRQFLKHDYSDLSLNADASLDL